MGKMTDILEGLDHLMKEHVELKGGGARDNHPHEGDEKKVFMLEGGLPPPLSYARMGLQMYYMLIKDAVDDAMEIRYKTETIANEARGCKVRGEIYAYYGSDIFNHCCASIRPCYWGLLFRSDVPFALEGDKIPLRKSVLAVPKDAP
ncbi:hypothetical protein Tco_0589145 [Tanacetum coccineum]